MKKSMVIPAILVLLAPMAADADSYVLTVPLEDLTVVQVNGNEAWLISLPIQDIVTEESLVAAHMKIRGSNSDPSQQGFAEVQIAMWWEGEARIPPGKLGFVSELVLGDSSDMLTFDATPVLRDALQLGQQPLELVVGALDESVLGEATLEGLNAETGVLAEWTFHCKGAP